MTDLINPDAHLEDVVMAAIQRLSGATATGAAGGQRSSDNPEVIKIQAALVNLEKQITALSSRFDAFSTEQQTMKTDIAVIKSQQTYQSQAVKEDKDSTKTWGGWLFSVAALLISLLGFIYMFTRK